MKRVFIGVVPPEDIINSLSYSMTSYKKKKWGKDVKWVKPENLHLTLKFIGQVENDKIADIVSSVEVASLDFGAFMAEISGLKVFPNAVKPKIISAGIESRLLERLSENIEKSLFALGIPKEKRKFKGHITLGRCKRSFPRSSRQTISDTIINTPFKIKEIIIFQSILRPNGPEYIVEKKVPIF